MIRRILLLLLVVVVLLWSPDDYDGGGRSLLLVSSWSSRRFMVHAMVGVVAHPPQPQRLSSSVSSVSLPWGSSQRTSNNDDDGWYRRRCCTTRGPVSSLPPGRTRTRTTTAVWNTKRDWEEDSRHNEENNNHKNKKDQPLVPRGGGELGEPSSEPHSQSHSGRQRGGRRQGMIAFTLALSYFTIMGAKCALPTVLPMLLSTSTSSSGSSSSSSLTFAPGQDPTTSLQQMVTWSTIAIAVGKLVLGPLIDAVGGSWALTSLLTLLSSLFLVLSVTTRFTTFGRAYIAIDFFFSAGWPACIHAIHQYFAPQQWGARIGQLAMGARAGNAVAFAVFAQLLQQPQSSFNNKWTTQWFPSCWQDQAWRRIFALCSVIQWIPLILLSLFCKHHNHRLTRTLTTMTTTPLTPESNNNSSNNKTPIQTKPVGPSFSSLWSSLQRTWSIAWGQAQTVDFWLQFINRSVLMVFASMLLFVPTVLCQLYQTSSAVGAQAGSLYATGCLLAVWLGAQPYATLARPHEDGNENDDHDRPPHASHPATLTNGSTNQNTTTTTIPKWWTTRTYRHVAVLLFLLSSATAASAIHWAHASPRLPWLTLSPSLAALAFLVWGAAMAIPFYSTFVSVCGGDGGAIVVVSRLFSIYHFDWFVSCSCVLLSIDFDCGYTSAAAAAVSIMIL